MKFSVLVPVYQAERFLDACIQSVLCQTFTDFELILVDDGSKDRSGAICDAYAEKDARIRAFHKENGGQFSARSFALQHASGEIIVFLDADDALKENALERMEQTFAEYRCDCVFVGLDRVENGTVISSQVEPETSARFCANSCSPRVTIPCARRRSARTACPRTNTIQSSIKCATEKIFCKVSGSTAGSAPSFS